MSTINLGGELLTPTGGRERSKPKPLNTPTLSIVIPALNEEKSIADIVHRVEAVEDSLRKVGVECVETIVVDDGSRDNTAQIAANLPSVRLLRHPSNRGYGAAIKTGFRHAQGELLAFLDADGTYPPEEFPVLCQAALSQDADLVVGSRRSGADSQMPPIRRLGNFLWSNLISVTGNRRCSDPASGMRVLRRSVLPRLYPLPDGLNFTPVMSTRAIHEELKMVEVPIPYHERLGHSKLSVVRDGLRFLKTIIWTVLEYNPLKVLGLVGLTLFATAGFLGLGLVTLRLQGITSLGPWGVLSVFGALVLAVAGVSIYSLGMTFNSLVALFRRQSLLQGRLRRSFFNRPVESHFGWLGGLGILGGTALAGTSLILGLQGWEIARLWLWLLGSALFMLVGLQLLISWILMQVLEVLSRRDVMISKEMGLDPSISVGRRRERKVPERQVREAPAS